MCGDHGVVSEGVTQTGSDVTKIVADNFANNCSTVCYMAGCANVDVFVFDVGIDCEEYPEKNVVKNKVINRKVARGTKNIAAEEGMTLSQCEKAVNTGIEAVRDLKLQGYKIIATGEMGIGNTTPTSALCAILLDKSPTEVTGRGAGLSNEGLNKKYEVVKRIVERVKNLGITDAFEILAQAGGYDIAGLVGVFLGGVKYDVPIVIDGAISSVAALVANEIDPRVKNIAIASHQSDESTGKFALDAMGLSALVHGKMCLGEGTGAMTIFPILDMALEVYGKLEFFGDFDIEPYKRFE
jgi:nicotinate-nucleotide--dimethylbenzimidazole phosphoribosyltransferase